MNQKIVLEFGSAEYEKEIDKIRNRGRPRENKDRLCHWKDKLKCQYCDIYTGRANFSKHKKTKRHITNVEKFNKEWLDKINKFDQKNNISDRVRRIDQKVE